MIGKNPNSTKLCTFCLWRVAWSRLPIVRYIGQADLSPWYCISIVLSIANSIGTIVAPLGTFSCVLHHQSTVYISLYIQLSLPVLLNYLTRAYARWFANGQWPIKNSTTFTTSQYIIW